MEMIRLVLLSFVFVVSLAACSTAKVRIMPGENGVNTIVSTDYEKDDAEEALVDKAKDYCKDSNKQAIFLKNGSNYTGKMDEGTRNTVKKASNAAILVGGAGYGTHNNTAGGVLSGAGIVGRTMVNDRDYRAEAQFKCQ
jgi:hypothetical protein